MNVIITKLTSDIVNYQSRFGLNHSILFELRTNVHFEQINLKLKFSINLNLFDMIRLMTKYY